MNIDYNAYLPTAKDIALKDEPTKHIQRKRKDIEREKHAHDSFMHKDKGGFRLFEKLL